MTIDFNVLKLFQQGNGFILFGGLLLIAGLVICARQLANLVKDFSGRQATSALRPQLAVGRRSAFLLLGLIVLLTGTSLLLAGAALRSYISFTRADQIGIVECLEWNPVDKFMVISFTRIQEGREVNTQTYSVFGDQWEVSAHILKWNSRLNLFGLHTGYRLAQIKGSYREADQAGSRQHRAYALDASRDWLWSWLSRWDRRLPGVEAVYGNAVSRPARAGEAFDIFVTTSGLSARRRQP